MKTSLPLTLISWLTLTAMIHAQDPVVQQHIARGDIADLAFKADVALKEYLSADILEPNNAPLLVRIARQYRHLMSDAKTDKMKLELGNNSLTYALRAAKLAPDDSAAQISPAITYGKMMPFMTKQQQYDGTLFIKSAADRSLKLNPLNDNAWHVMGRWHQALANVGALKRTLGGMLYGKLPTSTNEAAITCFKNAITINPKSVRHQIEMGKTYALMGQQASARTHLEKGLAMTELENDDASMKVQGRAVLATLPKAP